MNPRYHTEDIRAALSAEDVKEFVVPSVVAVTAARATPIEQPLIRCMDSKLIAPQAR